MQSWFIAPTKFYKWQIQQLWHMKATLLLHVQYTTRENGQCLASVTQGKFCQNDALRRASCVSLWNQVPSTELKMSRTRISRNRKYVLWVLRDPHEGLAFFVQFHVLCTVYVCSIQLIKNMWSPVTQDMLLAQTKWFSLPLCDFTAEVRLIWSMAYAVFMKQIHTAFLGRGSSGLLKYHFFQKNFRHSARRTPQRGRQS